MRTEKFNLIVTDSSTQYTGTLSAGQKEEEILKGLIADGRGSITIITIRSKQRLSWTLQILNSLSEILATADFNADDASLGTITGVEAGDYWYISNEVKWSNFRTDTVADKLLYGRLINADTTTKQAGTPGSVQVQMGVKRLI